MLAARERRLSLTGPDRSGAGPVGSKGGVSLGPGGGRLGRAAPPLGCLTQKSLVATFFVAALGSGEKILLNKYWAVGKVTMCFSYGFHCKSAS